MQPQEPANDQYQPKWRHFHPQATVWLLNPFDHDVIFRVADENNNQSEFLIQARERAELPGGPIATLGLKAIVNEMMQNSKEDATHIYNYPKRGEYEDKVILRVKEAPSASTSKSVDGPIDLSIKSDKEETTSAPVAETTKPFAEVPENDNYKPETQVVQPVGAKAPPLSGIAEASLGGADQLVESD